MINIDNVEKFVTEELAQGKHFSLRKEGWIELITRLRQAEKDAARYRSAVSILGEASEMLQLLSLSASNASERNMERVDAVVYEIDLELLKCNK